MVIKICQECNNSYEDLRVGDYSYPYLCSKCQKGKVKTYKRIEGTTRRNCFGVYFIIALAFILITSMQVNASVQSFGTFKTNSCISLIQTCSNCTSNNITSLINPNSTIALYLVPMNKTGTVFNYTFCDTSNIGSYIVNGVGDINGVVRVWAYDFQVTGNGKPNASGGVIVLFIIAFLILVGITCYLAIYTIGHLLSLDFDLIDLAFDWGVFFSIIALYFLETFYLGNAGIEKYLLWFISVGGIFMVLVPIIALVLSITIGSLNKKKVSMRVPKRFFSGGAR